MVGRVLGGGGGWWRGAAFSGPQCPRGRQQTPWSWEDGFWPIRTGLSKSRRGVWLVLSHLCTCLSALFFFFFQRSWKPLWVPVHLWMVGEGKS